MVSAYFLLAYQIVYEAVPIDHETPTVPNVSPTANQPQNPVAPLGNEEYIEQAHFFRSLGKRLVENLPAQEVLQSVREEVLATTKLPMAIDFLLSELRHSGMMGSAFHKLQHYFTPFQAFVIDEAEKERGRFDMRVGLDILQRDAQYRSASSAGDEEGFLKPGVEPTRQGLFLYQFEAICRNRLGYDRGLEAVANDPGFDETWRKWILTIRRQVGLVDVADLIYVHSEHYAERSRRNQSRDDATQDVAANAGAILFGDREGRIALANRRKDPLFLFNSLHRQLGYPKVPRPAPPVSEELNLPQIARRLEQLEKRISLLEEESRGGIDLTKFYQPPPSS